MGPYQVAQWFVNNPGSFQAFVDELGCIASVREMMRLADYIQSTAYEYMNDPNDDPGEQQEWHDFDPDC